MAENTIIHEISLAGYKATSTGGMLDLGTWGSYGIEKLHLTLDAAWQDLTITAFFNVNGKVVAKRVVGKDGYADAPWEATKENTFAGCLAFEGSINGQRRISTNLNYKVTNHSETTDSDPVPTDDRWNQFVTETKEYRDGAFEAAERANARAEDAETASEDAQAAARAAKASENAAAASASNAAASADKAGPYAKAAQAAQEAAENAAAAAAASKSAADTLAAEAARAALAAENSKAAANNAAYFAGENATAAQKAAATATAAANDAGQSASDAGQSASDAAASKAAAETAAKAAQDAQTATAAAKADAVKAQTAAQAAAKKAQDAKSAAEKVRDDAKTAQKGAEAARDVAAKSAEAAAKSEANVKQSADTLAESVKNITPDDSSIGDKPWSSKHIIDMLCPPLEESGNPVVCYPVAGYALGVKAMWEPAQEGTGTPSPENIRPIKGRDSVMVDRCGENVIEFLSTEDSSSDIKIAVDAEKNITLNGTLAGFGLNDYIGPGLAAVREVAVGIQSRKVARFAGLFLVGLAAQVDAPGQLFCIAFSVLTENEGDAHYIRKLHDAASLLADELTRFTGNVDFVLGILSQHINQAERSKNLALAHADNALAGGGQIFGFRVGNNHRLDQLLAGLRISAYGFGVEATHKIVLL
jgi:hypothetical protein